MDGVGEGVAFKDSANEEKVSFYLQCFQGKCMSVKGDLAEMALSEQYLR